jgi:polyphosphate kinase 2 (PPK2 family)
MAKARDSKPASGSFSLNKLREGRPMAPKRYFAELATLQTKLQRIQQSYLHTGASAAIIFEGWDAAGKGGTIRRMAAVLDPRGFKVWPIGAPRGAEAEQHYLARFWQRLPPRGAISVFDRSWYGRVLVERVEGLASPEAWGRAYGEINQFEGQLNNDGIRVVKLFLHISKEEQYRRFEERLRNPLKRWKLSYEDFRNRERWEDYEQAITDMVRKTSTASAPWHVVPANDKRNARLEALRIITKTLAKGVDLGPPPLDDEVRAKAEGMFGFPVEGK